MDACASQIELDAEAFLQVRNIMSLQLQTHGDCYAFGSSVGLIPAGRLTKRWGIRWLTVLAAGVLWAADHSRADDWPAWRGQAGTGVANETHLPQRWSTNENVRWRSPLPERGNSTPIVVGNRVFVTQA